MKFENLGNPQKCLLKAVTDVAAISMEKNEVLNTPKSSNGIGIVEFFEGKNVLVTGATGFLAKGNFI